MAVLILTGVFVFSWFITWSTNWLALIPWRRTNGQHWSERARVLYPTFVAAKANHWYIPGIFVIAGLTFLPDKYPHWIYVGIVASLGVTAGSISMQEEIFPRVLRRDWVRQSIFNCVTRFSNWMIFFGALLLMPNEFNRKALDICLITFIIWRVLSHCRFWLFEKLGLLRHPPERLRLIATKTSEKMRIPFSQLWLMSSPIAQAYALPKKRKLIFTARLMELLDDREVAAVCAHELAHLTESRVARLTRSIRSLLFLPWIFFNPIINTFGPIAILVMGICTIGIPTIFLRISRRLEVRADKIAKTIDTDEGAYAKALLKLHEDSFLPAVTSVKNSTHPNLYDRLMAAGMTPDFPRPKAAVSVSWTFLVFQVIFGFCLGLYYIRFLNPGP